MSLKNTVEGWGWLARALHWTIGTIILGLLIAGFYMVYIVGDDFAGLQARLELTQIHKSFGFTVFFLALARIVWRLANPSPALPEGMSAPERFAAKGGHVALYVLTLAIPVTGWLMATSSPLNDPGAYPMQIKNMVFGLFEMPDLYPKGDKALSELFGQMHSWAGILLSLVLLGHVGAALKHHFVNRDRVLRRMLVGR